MNLSPRVSICSSRRQHGGQGSCQRLARKDLQGQVGSRADKALSPAGQSLQQPIPRDSSMVWSSTLVGGAQLSRQWSGACLSYTLTVVDSTLLSLLISALAPLMVSEEFAQEPTYGWAHSADMAVLITRADISGVSPCQMCLL
ncbi:hypothetical protein HJG60_008717 [Phyllostomus discolor]|uniref:Uncharacterized protein n=1 Tax=Phyllostomus discolor TaxID=89673 RepID=A0A834DFU3_9CHIR|nr:hypothetical protein HJG60_008717 [Phyllostomus discolor]